MKCVLWLTLAGCLVSQVFSMAANVNKLACIQDADVNPSFVEKAYDGKFSDARELKCYFKCYYENAEYMNSKGEINADKLKADIPSGISRTMANRAIDLCKTQKGNDGCETAFKVQKCLINNSVPF